MTKELWKGAKQRSVIGAYTKEWSGDPTDEKLGGMWAGRDSTRSGPVKYPSMDDLAHEPGPTPNKYVRNVLNPGGLGQVHVPHGDPQYAAGEDDGKHTIRKWHGDGGFSGPMMGKKPMTYSNKSVTNVNRKMYQNTTGNHPDWGSDTGKSRKGASGSAKGTRMGGLVGGAAATPGRGKLFTSKANPLPTRGRGGYGTDTAAPRAVARNAYSAAKGGTGGMGGFGAKPKAQAKGRGKYTWR